MIARLLPALLVLAALAIAAPASATSFGVGDCSKAGLCAGGCVDCPSGDLACVGASYQVPQCVGASATTTTSSTSSSGGDLAPRCVGLPCEVLNAVCYTATKHWCVG